MGQLSGGWSACFPVPFHHGAAPLVAGVYAQCIPLAVESLAPRTFVSLEAGAAGMFRVPPPPSLALCFSVWINPAGQGVKLVLPALLKGVEDKAWRTKQGSIQARFCS